MHVREPATVYKLALESSFNEITYKPLRASVYTIYRYIDHHGVPWFKGKSPKIPGILVRNTPSNVKNPRYGLDRYVPTQVPCLRITAQFTTYSRFRQQQIESWVLFMNSWAEGLKLYFCLLYAPS